MGASSLFLAVAIIVASAVTQRSGSVSALTSNAPPSRMTHSDRRLAAPVGHISTARLRPYRRRPHHRSDPGHVPSHVCRVHFSELRMSPASLDDDAKNEATASGTNGESASQRKETKNPIDRYFRSKSSLGLHKVISLCLIGVQVHVQISFFELRRFFSGGLNFLLQYL